MQESEIEGKTIDEAIEKACAEFNVPREKLNIEIISEGTAGFLGLGSKKAKIKASIMSLDISLDVSFGETHKKKEQTKIEAHRNKEQPKAPAVVSPQLERAEARESGESSAINAKRFLEGLLQRMNLDCPVSVEETPDRIILNVKGDGGGLLIGKRGQNLDAIQYIVNKVVSRTANDRKMIVVDTEAYRKRREESLVFLAEKLGEKVKRTKKAMTVGHMHAHDRRIIHLALQDDDSLTTKSRGEGEYRKIIIMPVKKE